MLPHLLHTTGRAVAVVQNQTHTIRNVLQLQSSGPSSGSGSNWGNGPGPGGSKYGAGSRFYAGYNNAGRAVTQANAVTSHDGQISQSDENDDLVIKRPVLSAPAQKRRHRMRSSSVSMGVTGRVERGEKMGVLKTVQLHARGKHAFAPESMALAKERLLADPILSIPVTQSTIQPQPLLVRRNSTSAPLSPLLTPSEPPISTIPQPPPIEESPRRSPTPRPTDAAKQPERSSPKLDGRAPSDARTQTATPPPTFRNHESRYFKALVPLVEAKDWDGITAVISAMLADKATPSLHLFNEALAALVRTRIEGRPLTTIIKLYDTMLEKSVVPDVTTYDILILALTLRDQDLHNAKLSLALRLKRRSLVGRDEAVSSESDRERLKSSSKEDNFASAMSLFEGVLAINGRDQLRESTIIRLLASAANHNDVTAAIHIFAQLEARVESHRKSSAYRSLILAFSNVGRIDQAEEIFQDYLASCKAGRITSAPGITLDIRQEQQIQVWNMMIEAYFRANQPGKAIDLVDRMSRTKADDAFTMADVPITTPSTFSTVIAGFIQAGDIKTALAWFNKLLDLPDKAPENPYQGLGGKPMRPDSWSWHMMIDALALHGRVLELARLFKVLKGLQATDGLEIHLGDVQIVYEVLLGQLNTLDNAQTIETLRFLLDDVVTRTQGAFPKQRLTNSISKALAERGVFDVSVMAFYENLQEIMAIHSKGDAAPPLLRHPWLHQFAGEFIQTVYEAAQKGLGQLDFSSALMLGRIAYHLGLQPQLKFAPFFLDAYGRNRTQNPALHDEFFVQDWNILLTYAVHFEDNQLDNNPEHLFVIPDFAFNGLRSILVDLADKGHTLDIFDLELRQRIIMVLDKQFGSEGRAEIMEGLGSPYAEASQKYEQLQYAALENSIHQSPDAYLQPADHLVFDHKTAEVYNGNVSVDSYISDRIMALEGPGFSSQRLDLLQKAYSVFEDGLVQRRLPSILVLSKLIQAVGRVKWMDKLRELYTAAQAILPALAVEAQLTEWARVEDSMIIALAHAGHVDAAHIHRLRILDQGLCPSPDSYAILIQLVKDTTDDTSGAMALYQEAMEHGVRPNMYLYNNIISKLAKARKADYALELFQQMKASGIRPSSITYGAVIGACARVGDVQSAEFYFKEMTSSLTFKPRVPPYNTMMQLYCATKPNRKGVLHFYNEMLQAGVKPSAHTYKLLLDAYGSIEPVLLPKMEQIFAELQQDRYVEMTGAHFASMINAYGCVSKNFDKAISVFEALLNGGYARAPKPDAVVFEAIINVVVAHKRTELIPVYVSKMTEAGVHMTAYIANFLIKGFANVGDMEQARAIFESLSNPPIGVAAPNNHAPHSPEVGSEVPISIMEPVYREPSTWEVMVRAELGAGNRDAAWNLLERLKERQYPEAVYSRISGILTDYSIPDLS